MCVYVQYMWGSNRVRARKWISSPTLCALLCFALRVALCCAARAIRFRRSHVNWNFSRRAPHTCTLRLRYSTVQWETQYSCAASLNLIPLVSPTMSRTCHEKMSFLHQNNNDNIDSGGGGTRENRGNLRLKRRRERLLQTEGLTIIGTSVSTRAEPTCENARPEPNFRERHELRFAVKYID